LGTFEALSEAINVLANPMAIGMILLGAILGITFGALPGFSPITGMALILPFTFGMDPMLAMILYAGIIASAHFGGAIPAILLNTPGTTPNACTCFDGFPLARQGQASRALSIAATCSGVGTVIGLTCLIIAIPIIRPFVLSFMTPDFFWLVVFGLVTIAFASKGNLLKGLAGGGLGIMLALIGYSGMFAVERYTLNSYYLWDGIKLVPFVIGLFAISEIIIYASKGGTIASTGNLGKQVGSWMAQVKQGIKDVFSRPLILLRSGMIGAIIGAIPGVGGSAANFISYTVAMQSSRHPEEYGKGSIEGLIASETANDAKDAPALLPTTAFGIPGSPDTAILLAALILHGLTPGPLLLRDDLPIVMMLILGIFLSQIFTSGVGLVSANLLARITTIKVHYIAPFIMVLCVAGSFAYRTYIWDVMLAVILGLVGYLLKKYDFRIITIVIGFMLGGMAERYFNTSLQISRGDYGVFFSNPISVVLIVLIAFMLSFPFVRNWIEERREKKKAAEKETVVKSEELPVAKAEEKKEEAKEKRKPWKNGEFIVTAFLTFFVGAMFITTLGYRPEVRLVPMLVSGFTLIMLGGLLVLQFYPNLMKKMEVGLEDMLGASSPEKESEETEQASTAGIMRMIYWIVGFFVSIFLLGIKVSFPLFILSFILIEGKERLWKAFLVTAVGSALIFIALDFLGITLWVGALPEIIPGILGGSNIPRL